jgi:hypothetical protein
MSVGKDTIEPMNELIEKIKEARIAWQEIAQAEIEDGYSDAILSIERGEAEGYYFGLKSAYIILNGHEPDLEIGEDEE